MQSNLILYSNIYPWNGRWRGGDHEFMSKIWDVAALQALDSLEKKKEVELTPYQREIYECSIQCPELPRGDNPWGHDAVGKRICKCRNYSCARFLECRGGKAALGEEYNVWISESEKGLDRFNELWEANCKWCRETSDYETSKIGNIDLERVYATEEFEGVPQIDKNDIPDPKVGFEYPDDEEFEDVGLIYTKDAT